MKMKEMRISLIISAKWVLKSITMTTSTWVLKTITTTMYNECNVIKMYKNDYKSYSKELTMGQITALNVF